jgi:broad specificity phosphatase PhoE
LTRVVLVRHGETEWNREDRFRGRIDVDLNETGRSQAEACARRIAARWKPAAVYSSPLSRALHTAEPIARHCGLAVKTLDAVADLDYGQWHGLTPAEARIRWPDAIDAWFQKPGSSKPPAGESLLSLQKRAVSALHSLRPHHGDATVVVVAHDIVNRVLLLAAFDAGLAAVFRIGQATSAINVIDVAESGLRPVVVNDTCHLG